MNNNLQKGGFFFAKSYCDRFEDEAKSGSGSTSGGNLHGEQLDKLNTMAKQLRILLNIATADKGKEEEVRQAMKEGYDKFIHNEDQMVKDIKQAEEIEKKADAEFADAKKAYGKSFFQRMKNSSAIKQAREARTNLINQAKQKREGLMKNLENRAKGLDEAAFRRFPKTLPTEETLPGQVNAGMYPDAKISLDDSQGEPGPQGEQGEQRVDGVPMSIPVVPVVQDKVDPRHRFSSRLKRPSFGRSGFSTPNFGRLLRRNSTPANMDKVESTTSTVSTSSGRGGTIKKNKKNKGQKITRKKINKKYKKSRNTKRQKYKKSGNTKRQKYKKSGNTKRQKHKKSKKI